MDVEGDGKQGGLEEDMGARQNISAPVPERTKLSKQVSIHHLQCGCLIPPSFRNLICKEMTLSEKPGEVGWNQTHSSYLHGAPFPQSHTASPHQLTLPSLTPLGCAVGTASALLP